MKVMKIITGTLLAFLISLVFISCASKHMYMTPVSTVKPDSLLQITDEKIREAFESEPQLTKPLIVGVYNASFDDHPFLDSLEKLEDIKSLFEISPWLIEGEEYRRRKESRWHYRYQEPKPTPIKAVRLQAAKGKADLLVYCGVTHSYKEDPNWLAWTYFGLLTMAFIPGQKYRLTTKVDLFFIDVRNGYMYGTYHDEIVERKNYVHLSYSGSVRFEEKKRRQVEKLLPEMVKAVERVLDNDEFYLQTGQQKVKDLNEVNPLKEKEAENEK